MDIEKFREREIVGVQIFYLYVVPIALLYFRIIPGEFRILMLLTVSLVLLGIVRHSHWTFADIGISKDFMKDIVPYLIFTVSGLAFTIWISSVVLHDPLLGWWENIRFLLLFIPISILQEIIFRGILMNMLRRAFENPFTIIVLNASVFTLIHIIYLNSIFVLPFTFIAGIGFAWMYWKYPNLILISFSHTVLNFTAMILGFFIVR